MKEKIQKFSINSLQIEAWKLLQQGLNYYQIARKLNRGYKEIKDSLEAFERNYPLLLEKIIEIERFRGKILSFREAVTEGIEQKVREGYKLGTPPIGYIKQKGKLIIHPEEAKLVKRIFEDRIKGKSLHQLSRETGLPRRTIKRMLANVTYKGQVEWKGQIFNGLHEPIVDAETWQKAQPTSFAYRYAPAPLGYRKVMDRLVVDPANAEKVRKIFAKRIEGKSFNQISRELGIPSTSISHILRNVVYIGKLKVEGQIVDGDHEPIVDPKTWIAAQAIRHRKWDVASEKSRMIGKKNEEKILNFLEEKGPAAVLEISKEIGLTEGCIRSHLYRLEKEGQVERVPPKYKRKGAEWQVCKPK